jgi:siroheme synthase
VVASLETIAEAAKRDNVEPPATLVIGEVVRRRVKAPVPVSSLLAAICP